MTKQEVLKFQRLYINQFKDFEPLYYLELYIYDVWITKEEVLNLRSLYIICGITKKGVLKLRRLYIM